MIAEAPATPLAADRQRRAVAFDFELIEFGLRPLRLDLEGIAVADGDVIRARTLDPVATVERICFRRRRAHLFGERRAALFLPPATCLPPHPTPSNRHPLPHFQ